MGIVTEIILPLAMAFIMFALGLGLTLADFTRVAKMPRDFIIGLASQLILLPLIALLLIGLWNLPAELALGVMIIAAAPGGVTSNILTSFAKGDVALSISLTAIISLISVISIPIIIGFSYNLLFDGDGKNINIKGNNVVITAEQVKRGKRLFNNACHVGGLTKTNPNAGSITKFSNAFLLEITSLILLVKARPLCFCKLVWIQSQKYILTLKKR